MQSTALTKQHQDTSKTMGNHSEKGTGKSLPAVPVIHNDAAVQLMAPETDDHSQLQLKADSRSPILAAHLPPFDLKNPMGQKADPSPSKNAAQLKAFQLKGSKSNEAPKSNHTGLPDQLRSGVEQLSGYSLADVKVHYNSAKPAQLQAFSYAQGANIHVAPGQEKHLPHEAWHVVQQKQGRVKPTLQMKGNIAINDDHGLESEADVMGSKAALIGETTTSDAAPETGSMQGFTLQKKTFTFQKTQPIQRALTINGAPVIAPNAITAAEVGDVELRQVMQTWIGRTHAYAYADWEAAEVAAQAEVNGYRTFRDDDGAGFADGAEAAFTAAEVVNLHAIGDERIFQALDTAEAVKAKAVSDASGIGAIEVLWQLAEGNFADLFITLASAAINASIAGIGRDRFAELIALTPSMAAWVNLTANFSNARINHLDDNDVILRLLQTNNANRAAIAGQWAGLNASMDTVGATERIIALLTAGITAADIATALAINGVTPNRIRDMLAVCVNMAAVILNLRTGITHYHLTYAEVYAICQANVNGALALLDPLFRARLALLATIEASAIQYMAATHGIATAAILQITYTESRRTVFERQNNGGSYHIFAVTVGNVAQPEEIHCHVTGTAFNSPASGVTHYKTPGAGGRAQIMGGPIEGQILGLINAGNYIQQGQW